MKEDGGVVHKLGVWNIISINKEAVRHQWVPVVEVVELQSDAVAVLEKLIKKQRGIELQLKQVATQLLHVVFYYDVDYLAWKTKQVSSFDVTN